MKNIKNTINIMILSVVFTAVAVFSSPATVFAEPDETYAIESFVAETTSEALTDEFSEETEPEETEIQVETETAETTDAEEETQSAEPTETQSEVSETTKALTEAVTQAPTEPSYRAPLPTVEDNVIIPPAVVGATDEENEPSLFWGFVSWILIGVGLAVIFAVVLSTKAKGYRGGRDRYSSTDKISGKKKLLSQDYYDERKRR